MAFLDTHLHSPQRLAQLWTLDLKAQCEVRELGAGPPECHFYHEREQGAAAYRPPSNKVASPTSPSQPDLQDRPLDLTPGEGLGVRQGHLDLVPHLMEAS